MDKYNIIAIAFIIIHLTITSVLYAVGNVWAALAYSFGVMIVGIYFAVLDRLATR